MFDVYQQQKIPVRGYFKIDLNISFIVHFAHAYYCGPRAALRAKAQKQNKT